MIYVLLAVIIALLVTKLLWMRRFAKRMDGYDARFAEILKKLAR